MASAPAELFRRVIASLDAELNTVIARKADM